MSQNHRISIITVPDKRFDEDKIECNEEDKKKEPADFEAAIAAAGYGRFHYLLFLAIIPVSWANSLDTSSVAMILPSAECDLQMTFVQKGILNATIYVGMVSGGYLWGYIADVKGRRKIIIYGYLADGICNVLCGFSQNFWMLASFKFVSGFIVSGAHASVITYASEFHGVKGRMKIPLLIGLSITSGNVVAAVLSWLIIPQEWSIILWDGAFVYNSWRIFLSTCGVSSLIGVICLSLFPESPKFLTSEGRTEDALKVFQTIYRMNTGKPAEEYPIKHLKNETFDKESSDLDQDGKLDKKAIFFYPYILRLLLVTIMQFGSMYATNTLRLWQPQIFTILDNFDPIDHNLPAEHTSTFCEILDLSSVANETSAAVGNVTTCRNLVVKESVYINTIIITVFGGSLILAASFAVKCLNYKIILFFSYGVTLTSIICMYWSTQTLITLVLTSFFVGWSNTAQNVIISATVMLFPTSLRTIAVSLVMTSGRIGSVIGNILFPILLIEGCVVPIIQMACLMLLCIILTCFLSSAKKKASK